MKIHRLFLGLAMFCAVTLCSIEIASAQSTSTIPQWAAVAHHLALEDHPNFPSGSPTGVFPPIISEYLPSLNPAGVMETYNLAAPTQTNTNPFFQSLGSNGRACAT